MASTREIDDDDFIDGNMIQEKFKQLHKEIKSNNNLLNIKQQCSLCNDIYSNKLFFKWHVLIYHMKIKCPLCNGVYYSYIPDYIGHLQFHLRIEVELEYLRNEISKSLKIYPSLENYLRYIKNSKKINTTKTIDLNDKTHVLTNRELDEKIKCDLHNTKLDDKNYTFVYLLMNKDTSILPEIFHNDIKKQQEYFLKGIEYIGKSTDSDTTPMLRRYSKHRNEKTINTSNVVMIKLCDSISESISIIKETFLINWFPDDTIFNQRASIGYGLQQIITDDTQLKIVSTLLYNGFELWKKRYFNGLTCMMPSSELSADEINKLIDKSKINIETLLLSAPATSTTLLTGATPPPPPPSSTTTPTTTTPPPPPPPPPQPPTTTTTTTTTTAVASSSSSSSSKKMTITQAIFFTTCQITALSNNLITPIQDLLNASENDKSYSTGCDILLSASDINQIYSDDSQLDDNIKDKKAKIKVIELCNRYKNHNLLQNEVEKSIQLLDEKKDDNSVTAKILLNQFVFTKSGI